MCIIDLLAIRWPLNAATMGVDGIPYTLFVTIIAILYVQQGINNLFLLNTDKYLKTHLVGQPEAAVRNRSNCLDVIDEILTMSFHKRLWATLNIIHG